MLSQLYKCLSFSFLSYMGVIQIKTHFAVFTLKNLANVRFSGKYQSTKVLPTIDIHVNDLLP